jgi:Holliday junction resolvase RusA-like endonuclease
MTVGVSFTVPGEPIGKGRPRATTRAGHAALYTPKKTANYESLIAHAAHQAMAGAVPLECACQVQLSITVGVPASWSKKKQAAALLGEVLPTKKPDTDNVVKAVFDGMNGVVWRDDVQAVDLFVRKRYGSTPGVFVRVSRCGDAA